MQPYRGFNLFIICILFASLGVAFSYVFSNARLKKLNFAKSEPSRDGRLQDFIERSKPLVDAIYRFAADHGNPPQSLDELVPSYLWELPTTGFPESPKYTYSVLAAGERKKTRIWYDLVSLGRRKRYSDGGKFVFEFNGEDRVVVARTEGVDPRTVGVFEAHQYVLKRRSREDIVKLLGAPDGEKVTLLDPWSLSAEPFNWDLMDCGPLIYLPTGAYPDDWGTKTKGATGCTFTLPCKNRSLNREKAGMSFPSGPGKGTNQIAAKMYAKV